MFVRNGCTTIAGLLFFFSCVEGSGNAAVTLRFVHLHFPVTRARC